MAERRPDPEAEDLPEPPRLRHLRWLVNALLLTLMGGVITITALLVIRLGPWVAAPALPEVVVVPGGERVEAVTMGRDWIAVVTTDGAGGERIRILDRFTGLERASVPVVPAQ